MEKELLMARNNVALEFMHGGSINIPQLCGRILPTVSAHYKKFVSSFTFDFSGSSLQLSGDQRKFIKMIEKHRYLDLGPLNIYKPEGLNVTYLTYLDALENVAKYAVKAREQLDTFNTYVSALLSTKDAQRTTASNVQQFGVMQEIREALSKDLAKCMKNSNHDATDRYDNLLDRNSEWALVFQKHSTTVKEIETIDRKKLLEKASESSRLLDQVHLAYRRGELEEISPEAIRELAEGAYQIASELEFFAVTHYRIQALSTAIEQSMTRLTELKA